MTEWVNRMVDLFMNAAVHWTEVRFEFCDHEKLNACSQASIKDLL
jgi:hypothetical protein